MSAASVRLLRRSSRRTCAWPTPPETFASRSREPVLRKRPSRMSLRSSQWTRRFSRSESEDSSLDCWPKLTMDFASSCRSRQGLTGGPKPDDAHRAPATRGVLPILISATLPTARAALIFLHKALQQHHHPGFDRKQRAYGAPGQRGTHLPNRAERAGPELEE